MTYMNRDHNITCAAVICRAYQVEKPSYITHRASLSSQQSFSSVQHHDSSSSSNPSIMGDASDPSKFHGSSAPSYNCSDDDISKNFDDDIEASSNSSTGDADDATGPADPDKPSSPSLQLHQQRHRHRSPNTMLSLHLRPRRPGHKPTLRQKDTSQFWIWTEPK